MAARFGALLLAALLGQSALQVHARLLRSRGPGPACRVTGRIFELEGDFALLQEGRGRHRRASSSPHHLVIETPKPAVSGLRAAIQNESAGSFHRQPRVTFVTFDADADVERSPHGVPTLRSMFEAAIREFPQADTYTYFNSDIAVDRSFVDTADAVVRAVKTRELQPRFLVVGRRTNVDMIFGSDSADESSFMEQDSGSESSFMEQFRRGTLFEKDAEDYFMVSKGTWNWKSDIPAFIVGHRGFDNWLVSQAATTPRVDLVDATATLRAMHLTNPQIGNLEGHRPSADGADYNVRLMRGRQRGKFWYEWDCASTDAATLATKLVGEANRVVFVERPRSCF